MLARLLRRLILVQGFIALLIAMGLIHFAHLAPVLAWPLAAGWLLMLPALSNLRAFMRAQAHQGAQASPSPRSHWLRAMRVETLCTWRLFLWRQALASSTPPSGIADAALADAPPAGLLPVLLIHGFVCNHRIWDEMADSLRRRGHPVHRLDLEPLFCSIDAYAPRIEAAVAALLVEHRATRLAIVGHSMGGLAIRAWLHACPGRLVDVAVAITLGTPHRGTAIEPAPRPANGREMVHGSAWLAELARSESPALRERFEVSIARQDQIVFPQTEQWLPGMRVQVWDAMGHLALCSDPAVMARVAELIRARGASLEAMPTP